MDMAASNLLKHKIRFTSLGVHTSLFEPTWFIRTRYYRSSYIENVESLGLNDVNDLCKIFCKPLVLYTVSKVLHEDRVIPIDSIMITIGVAGFQKGEDYCLTCYTYNPIWDYPEFFYTDANAEYFSFPKHLLNERIYIFVNVTCDYLCSNLREEARFRSEFNYDRYWQHPMSIEEYLNSSDKEIPTETYRQDHCVICLEKEPNILYLDCMHIAICDSCDRLKETTGKRYKCDVCRAEISKRVKIYDIISVWKII